MARGMGAFAKGLMQGYMMTARNQREQELHDLQVEKAREEKAFKEELKAANSDLSPMEQFVVTGPDGATQVFDKQDDALKAMEGGGFNLSHNYMVGDESFGSAEEAQFAARRANSDVGKLGRQARIAMDYGQPQMATQLAQAADQIRRTRANALTDMTLQYKQAGNIEGLLNMYDQQAGDGGKTRVVEQGGKYMLVRDINGQTRPLMDQAVESPAEIFDLAAMGFSTNHENIVDIWKFEKTHGLGERQFEEQGRSNRAREGISAGNLAVNQAQLGIQQTKHQWEQEDRNNPKPEVHYGSDNAGQVVPYTTSLSRQPGGGWATTTTPGQPLPGVRSAAPRAESEVDRILREAREGNTGGATPRNAWSGPPVDGSGLVEMNNSRGVAPAAPTTPTATAPQGRFGDNIPDIIYDNSPGLRWTFPRSGGGN